MTPLPFVDGPRNGESYALVKDQPMPKEIRLKGGKYVLVRCRCETGKPVGEIHTHTPAHLLWRENK